MNFKIIIVLIFAIIFSEASIARDATVCNGAPVENLVAVSINRGQGYRSEGWYHLQPGECARFDGITDSKFYYYAKSNTDLAHWLANGSGIEWTGFHSFCIAHHAFDLPAKK